LTFNRDGKRPQAMNSLPPEMSKSHVEISSLWPLMWRQLGVVGMRGIMMQYDDNKTR